MAELAVFLALATLGVAAWIVVRVQTKQGDRLGRHLAEPRESV